MSSALAAVAERPFANPNCRSSPRPPAPARTASAGSRRVSPSNFNFVGVTVHHEHAHRSPARGAGGWRTSFLVSFGDATRAAAPVRRLHLQRGVTESSAGGRQWSAIYEIRTTDTSKRFINISFLNLFNPLNFVSGTGRERGGAPRGRADVTRRGRDVSVTRGRDRRPTLAPEQGPGGVRVARHAPRRPRPPLERVLDAGLLYL
ncbi:hypothetical protein EVAR_41821_1 [Eumeta japonica]|uniref:Uncharacterized protein n=1 Tax=Eumeta variegata TaxID=151549 RepID=A0A4C1XB02_EUMVA|nr:hypothetical protein EVAR_41821_1 [Eumeta japonica]